MHPFFTKRTNEIKQLPHGNAEQITEGVIVTYNHIGIAIDFSGEDEKIIQNALMIGDREATYTFIHVVESAAARYLGKNHWIMKPN